MLKATFKNVSKSIARKCEKERFYPSQIVLMIAVED